MKASLKRLVILAVTVFIFGLAVSAGNFIFSRFAPPEPPPPPPPPAPAPAGPVLESLEVLKLQAFKKKGSTYDILIQLKNPNSEHGAEDLSYSINFLNNTDVVKKINENSYILPNEEKYIVLTNVEINSAFNGMSMDLQSVTWRRLQEFVALNLDVFDLKFERLPPENNFYARLAAFVKNNSVFGLTDIKVFGILSDSSGNIVAVNRTSIQTVLEGEMREVEMFWTDELDFDNVQSFGVYAYSNIMKNDNFVRQFGADDPVEKRGPQGGSEKQNYFQLPELFDKFQGWSPF